MQLDNEENTTIDPETPVTFFNTSALVASGEKLDWVCTNVKMSVISNVGDLPGMAFVEEECLSLLMIAHPDLIIGNAPLYAVKVALANSAFDNGGTLTDIYNASLEVKNNAIETENSI